MGLRALFLSFLGLATAVVGTAAPVNAITLTISPPIDSSSSTFTGNAGDTSAATLAGYYGGGSVGDAPGNSVTGGAVLRWNVTGDSTNATADSRTLNVNYSITFSVAPDSLSTSYDVKIVASLNGGLTWLNEWAQGNGAGGFLSVSTIVATLDGNALPSLDIAGIAFPIGLINPGPPQGTAISYPLAQNRTHTLTGLTGDHTHTLNFAFTARVTTAASAMGDEVSLRFGLDSTLPNVSADDYPGVGGSGPEIRDEYSDGHFVRITTTVVPEPSTLVLMGFGLMAAHVAYRRR